MLISGIKSLFYSLSVLISGIVYPLIPKLYDLFIWLAQYKFLDNKDVQRIWNNIYVFVAVIVLFAIAIKLISTMVNPDSFSDNKKGVKNYYFRAVTSVVLIFIVPILFDYSFDIQKELLNNNFLTTRILGYEVEEGTNIGQVLAWEAFSSFCTPLEDGVKLMADGKVITINMIPDTNMDNYYKLAQKNIDFLVLFLDHMRRWDTTTNTVKKAILGNASSAIELEKAYNYHQILAPLAGCLIAYEFVLLCMDTLFRAVKLGFLELMLPIILGAYVFNPDILKKWAKEFFSTYITLFIKVLAVGLMIYGFAATKNMMANDKFFNSDWLRGGLFRLFFIIALLQLIKKIPDLINSIFGTQIKTQGGIKGRLGEMAGIGGLAQKAWAGLGKVGKLVAQAPLAVGFVVANKKYHDKHPGKWLKDNAMFQQGMGIAQGVRAGWKQGSLIAGYEGYQKGSEPPSHTRSQLTDTRNNVLDELALRGVLDRTSTGIVNQSWNNVKTRRDGTALTNPDGSMQYKDPTRLKNDISATQAILAERLGDSKAGRTVKELSSQNIVATKRYVDLQGLQDAGNGVKSKIDAVKAAMQEKQELYSAEDFTKVKEIASRWEGDGRYVTKEEGEFLKRFMVAPEAQQFQTTIKRYDNSLQNVLRDHTEYNAIDLFKTGALSGHVNNAKNESEALSASEQEAADKLSDVDKVTYQTLKKVRDDALNGYAIANKFDDSAPNSAIVYGEKKEFSVDQSWADNSTLSDGSKWWDDAGSGIPDGSQNASPSTDDNNIEENDSNIIETVEVFGNGSNDDNEYDMNTEEGMVRRVNELRSKRNSGSQLTDEEIEELNDRISSIRRMQRERHNNNNNE